jgi:hypothetical protein
MPSMRPLAFSAARATHPAAALPGLSLCLPVYNEEGAVGDTLRRCLAVAADLRRVGVEGFEVIAVDDGSRDRTAEIIASYPDVVLVRHQSNRGYGAALKTGFSAARFDLIGFLDADGTYPPEHLPRLCEAVLSNGADLVVGSRMAGAETEMPPVRRLGNAFFAWLLTLIGRTPVSDSASGMRVFKRSVLETLSPLPDGLNLTPVMSTRAAHERITVTEVPIPYNERVGPSKLRVVRDGARFLATIVSTALAYNPVRILGALGALAVIVAAVIAAVLVVLRVQNVTTLGPTGVLAVFVAMVCGVGGVSLFALGACFNYLVSLFHSRPIRQGLFKRPLIKRPIEQLFLPAGLLAGGLGLVVASGSFTMALRGWPIERLWLYLTASGMALLVALHLLVWWVMALVLSELTARAVSAERR